MKVYIVEASYTYENGFNIMGVFSTRELAQAKADRVLQETTIYDFLEITEVILDES